MSRRYLNLNPDKALIWRIVHRDNLPWILDNGLHCGNGSARSPGWVSKRKKKKQTKPNNYNTKR